MTTQELLKKVRKIELKTRGLSFQVFSGAYKTTFKGRGMSFSEVRTYQYGDDVRNIDWNVTARSNEPHVKVFEEERELTFMLLLDVSGSSLFGTVPSTKRDLAAEIAATLAFSAISNNDKVGAIFFSDKIEKYLPPQKGANHILRIIRELLYLRPRSKGSALAPALQYLVGLVKRRCTAFILSDFMMQGYESALKLAAQKHDIAGIHLYDRRELELPNVGLIPVQDAETGDVRWVDTNSERIRDSYRDWYDGNYTYFRRNFLQYGADILSVATDEGYVSALTKFFKERK